MRSRTVVSSTPSEIGFVLLPILMSLASATTADAGSACRIEARPTHAVEVIELYTSEGCSSCPPADRWLASLPERPDLAILAFHVDYWDALGWPDRFARAEFSARQRWRATRTAARTVYTPDVVHNGRSVHSWSRGWQPQPSAAAAPFALEVEVERLHDGRSLVRWQTDLDAGARRGLTLYAALTESGLHSLPARGENRGRRLDHAHVVRAFTGPIAFALGDAVLPPVADLSLSDARVNIVVEDATAARPVHAAVVSLRECAAEQRGDEPTRKVSR